MINLVCGNNGTGKTKYLVNTANGFVSDGLGHVVFIDTSNELMLALNHEIRFVNLTEFPINTCSELIGFISGMISEDYDIRFIMIDSIESLLKDWESSLEKTLDTLQILSEKYKVEFHIANNGEVESSPVLSKEFVA